MAAFHILPCFIPLSVCHYSVQYNSLVMKNKTAEEAYLEMLKPAEMVTLKVQQRVDEFNQLKDTAGDGFYIRYCGTLLSRHIYTLLVNFTLTHVSDMDWSKYGYNMLELCKGKF